MRNVVTDDQHHCSVSGVIFGSSMEQILKQMSLSKFVFQQICFVSEVYLIYQMMMVMYHCLMLKMTCWYYFCAAKNMFFRMILP